MLRFQENTVSYLQFLNSRFQLFAVFLSAIFKKQSEETISVEMFKMIYFVGIDL